MKKIVAFFIRHGATDLNDPPDGSEERFRGDADIGLNELGKQQAQELVPYFEGRNLSAAFHSEMQRTAQTLEPLMAAHNMKSVGVKALDSLNTGDFTGLPKTKEMRAKLDWFRKHPDVKIPGGEAVQEFRDRVDPKLMAVIRMGDEAGEPTVASVHGSIIRELSRLLHDGDYNKLKVDNGGIVAVFKDTDSADKEFFAQPVLKENPAEEDIPAGS